MDGTDESLSPVSLALPRGSRVTAPFGLSTQLLDAAMQGPGLCMLSLTLEMESLLEEAVAI